MVFVAEGLLLAHHFTFQAESGFNATPWRASHKKLSNLLSENTGAKRRLCAVGVPTFAIAENSEGTKVIQQLVVIQQVSGISRMADRLLIDQVGFKMR